MGSACNECDADGNAHVMWRDIYHTAGQAAIRTGRQADRLAHLPRGGAVLRRPITYVVLAVAADQRSPFKRTLVKTQRLTQRSSQRDKKTITFYGCVIVDSGCYSNACQRLEQRCWPGRDVNTDSILIQTSVSRQRRLVFAFASSWCHHGNFCDSNSRGVVVNDVISWHRGFTEKWCCGFWCNVCVRHQLR